MRQGYIDSQGNKYILTGVKAQFPRWTYAEWQAEGEPDIPWIRTDAPSGYRKVSGDDVSYDNTNSVNDKIDEVDGKILRAFSLLLPQTISSSTAVVSTYNGRKFSDYDMISFFVGTLDYTTGLFTVRSSCTVAKSSWMGANRRLILNALHGSATSSATNYNVGGINFEYRDDTSVKTELTGSLVINALEIVGYKIG